MTTIHPQESLGALARSKNARSLATRVSEAAEYFRENPLEEALAVTGEMDEPLGVVVRSRFLSLLARPFAWDVLSRRPVSEVMEEASVLPGDRPILRACSDLEMELESQEPVYYLLTDHWGSYTGMVTNRDLLIYLSRMTRADLDLAQTLQKKLIPTKLEVGEGSFTASGRTEMYHGVGGDFYQVRKLRDGRWFGCLGDVSGKGLSASVVSAFLWGFLEDEQFVAGLIPVLERLNRALVKAFDLEKFVTGCFWLMDPGTGDWEGADLGHSHFYFIHRGNLEKVKDELRCLPLGMDEDNPLVLQKRRLGPGDGFFVFSDGLVETARPDVGEFPLEATLESLLPLEEGQTAGDFIRNFEGIYSRFRSGAEIHDDITYLVTVF